jgi:hypothetical protein
MAMGQQQMDFWALILKIAEWAARIPLAGLAIFAAGCGAYLGFYFLLRTTQYVYWHWLSRPW